SRGRTGSSLLLHADFEGQSAAGILRAKGHLMARRPRTRDVDASTAQPGGSARREWLATWKAIAVARLPESASAAIRADLRRSVEQTLARLGPEHDNDEVADAVGAVVGILIEGLDAEAKEKAR